MSYKYLKFFRVFIAILFLLLASLAFVDFTGLFPEELIKGTMWIQFVPSLLTFSRLLTFTALAFVIVLIITLLVGRFYCASICPLGILQDVILRIARKFRKIKFRYHKPVRYIRHVLFGITAVTLVFGSLLALNFLDPYSLFGRIFSDLFRPVVIAFNNLMVGILHEFDIYTLYYVDLHPLSIAVYMVPVLFLILITYLTVTHGRLYCNTVCPVGTLLGYLSRFSIFSVRINTSNCTNCKLCESACKAECISLTDHTVDQSRCIACFNCLTVCNFNAIDFTNKKHNLEPVSIEHPGDPERRQVLKTLVGGALLSPLMSLGQDQEIYYTATVPIERNQYVTPPGSADVKEFLSKCTACHLCVSACPTQVIQPSKDQFGWEHFMQVRMDYKAGYCTYECTRCTEVCPTGALLPLEVKDKRLTQLGKVNFVKDNCIVNTEGTDCGSCAEHCPTKAVYMVPYEGDLRIPEVNDEICIGCGACEHVCPTRPYRAIYVEGNPVHVQAEKPKEKEAEAPDHEDDFPF